MKTLWGKVTVETNTDEIAYINELYRRDEAMLSTKHTGKINDYYKCGACNKYIVEDANFCHHCGQRIDTENFDF